MRVGLLGFSIECNRFAPVATEEDFRSRTWFEGAALLAEARGAAPRMLAELPGFVADMDKAGAWEAVPVMLAMAEPNGPVEHAVFLRMMAVWEAGLRGAGRLDGVYVVLHGAGLTTEEDDPEGALLALVREVVGPGVPVVASFDLHANVSERDVTLLDGFVGYRTNPHMDMRACGAESAGLLRRLMGGARTFLARVRLPIVPPTVTMLTEAASTKAGAPSRPYGELIDLGQRRMREAPYAGRVLNVSVMGGFAFADTAFNGLTVVVTALDPAAAEGLAREVAEGGWARRERFRAVLTPLAEAVRLALGTAQGGAGQGGAGLAFADVADNPGGGGRGNTLDILRAFAGAGVRDAVVGLIWDPQLAADAHRAGVGAEMMATFGRNAAELWAVEARVLALHDAPVLGRRGIFAGNTVPLGPMALLDVGGVRVAVASRRVQCADPAFLEALGVELGAVRCLVVKSRGHFRGGFDEYFRDEQVVEVDAPGLSSPRLERFEWKKLPRPVIPLDEDVTWS